MSPSSPSIDRHLTEWLGAWPPSGGVGPSRAGSDGAAGPSRAGSDGAVDVVASGGRSRPGWDGVVHPLIGVLTPTGGVLSVESDFAAGAKAHLAAGGDLTGLPAVIGRPDWRWIEGLFRYTTAPTDLADAGTWVPAGDRAVPAWLRVFGGDVLLTLDDDGRYVAGVGLKRHDRWGWEIAVGTEPAARGRGLARRLVAQAARAVVARGAVATYLHAFDNVASGRVAEAAGFPDLGWRSVAVIHGAP